MKFTDEQRELIKETRRKINKLKDEQTSLYSNLLSQLDMSERAEDWIFDYIYNNYGTIKKIESFLK
jgi:sugar-specific transcriptional regulator TrmB